jgi:hypothetical protein
VPLLLGPQFFFNYSFLVYYPVNRDDRHLLAHAMTSESAVAVFSKRTIVFLVTDQNPHPSE